VHNTKCLSGPPGSGNAAPERGKGQPGGLQRGADAPLCRDANDVFRRRAKLTKEPGGGKQRPPTLAGANSLGQNRCVLIGMIGRVADPERGLDSSLGFGLFGSQDVGYFRSFLGSWITWFSKGFLDGFSRIWTLGSQDVGYFWSFLGFWILVLNGCWTDFQDTD
jgi:hypothetical protein